MKKQKSYASTIILILGIVLLFAGISSASQGIETSGLESGLGMIAGALAFKSIRKRRMMADSKTFIRQMVEFLLLGLLGLILVLGLNTGLLIQDPIPFLVIPLVSFGFYIEERRKLKAQK